MGQVISPSSTGLRTRKRKVPYCSGGIAPPDQWISEIASPLRTISPFQPGGAWSSSTKSMPFGIRLRMPKGIDFVLLDQAPPGWKGEIVRKGDAISEIHWSGGAIPPEQYGTFRFLVRNPVEEGEITWPIVQTYAGGDVQRWIGPADSDEPASRTTIAESATPQDVVAVSGEKVPEAGAQRAAAPAAAAPE